MHGTKFVARLKIFIQNRKDYPICELDLINSFV